MATNPARAAAVLAAVAFALGMSACGASPAREEVPAPAPTAPGPTDAPSGVTETPEPAAEPTPGALCDPDDGDPDCTDSTTDGEFRHIEGFADCVAQFGAEEEYGVCTDLDGDGVHGYPDSH